MLCMIHAQFGFRNFNLAASFVNFGRELYMSAFDRHATQSQPGYSSERDCGNQSAPISRVMRAKINPPTCRQQKRRVAGKLPCVVKV